MSIHADTSFLSAIDVVPMRIFESAAGWFFGVADEDGRPLLRESGYFPTRETAAVALGSSCL